MAVQCPAGVLENRKLTDSVCLLRLEAPELAAAAAPGQFVHVRCGGGTLLRRPVSICMASDGAVTIVIEARGAGTRLLAGCRAGDAVDLLGPLGHGFDLSGRRPLLVGGGIGAPPLLFAAQRAGGGATAALGFRTGGCVILREEFERACLAVHLATDDGTAGRRGFVTDLAERLLESGDYDAVLACGPKAMLRAVAELAGRRGIPCQVSLEERMGCGVGACLVCACQTAADGETRMRRVCRDGPVFDASEVVWE